MGVRMSALRRCHVPSYNYEFGKGEEFDAVDEREATRLERRRRARRIPSGAPAGASAPERSSDSLFTAAQTAQQSSEDGAAGSPRKRRYQRRDMQAED